MFSVRVSTQQTASQMSNVGSTPEETLRPNGNPTDGCDISGVAEDAADRLDFPSPDARPVDVAEEAEP